jgi:hypothetical protein
MTEKPTTAQELEELFGEVDFKQLVKDQILKESAEEMQRQHYRHLMTTLYGSSFADMVMIEEKVFYKKIKRRIFYEVIWWGAESRHTKCFYSVKKMRKFVNELHRWYNEYIEIEKTFCYRDFTPRHKWYYISFKPNQFVCVEKW